MTNNEMLMAAIEFEEVEFASDLYYLIAHGIINGEDEFTLQGNDWNLVDRAISGEYIKNNLLSFDIVELYCVRLSVDDYEIIGARSEQEARGYFMNKYNFLPKIMKMDKSKWLKEFYFEEEKRVKSLLELRKENNIFPRHLLFV